LHRCELTRYAACSLAVLACIVSQRPALAAEPTPAEIAAARRLFAEARSAEDAEDWATAASRLRDAISIKETPGLRFHLAYCQEHLGMLVEALVDYERAEEAARSRNDEVGRQVGPRKEALRRRIPTITILLPEDVRDAALTIDGRAVASALLGKPVPQNPGQHHVVASAPGRASFAADLVLSEADSVVATAALAPIPSPSPPSPAPLGDPVAPSEASRATGSSARTYVLVGEAALSLAALGIGVGYVLSASAADERADRARSLLPDPSSSCASGPKPPACADLEQANADARDRRFVSRMAFVGAGVGAAGLAATWLLWRTPSSKRAVAPIVAAGMVGIYARARF